MTSITVNGKAQALTGQPTITEMLQELGLAEKRVAVELNREIIPRSLHGETRLKAGDCIEIVHAIGGG
jgi:sulfur carrier protein